MPGYFDSDTLILTYERSKVGKITPSHFLIIYTSDINYFDVCRIFTQNEVEAQILENTF